MKTHTRQLGPAIDALRGCLAEPQVLDETTALVIITNIDKLAKYLPDVERLIGFRIECAALAGGRARFEITSEVIEPSEVPA